VGETGGPVIVAPPKVHGFGSVLTKRSIIGQLGGKIEHDWQRDGLKLKLIVPLDRLSFETTATGCGDPR
jgi:hypothetical protein